MNWVRYQGALRRSDRRERERWVHEKLQEAIELKREQIRLGTRPKLSRTSIDPKKSYFLRRLIHLDKATGGVTWKLFEKSPLTLSDVVTSSAPSEERPDGRQQSVQPQNSRKMKLPTLQEGVQYPCSTKKLAREPQRTAAEEEQWVTRMKNIGESREETVTSESRSLSDHSSRSVTAISSQSSFPTNREQSRANETRIVETNANTPRKSFSAKEINAMLPQDSPDLNALRCSSRKRPAGRKRENKQRARERGLGKRTRLFHEKSEKCSDRAYSETSDSSTRSESILDSGESTSSGENSQTSSRADGSSLGSISEDVSRYTSSWRSSSSSQKTTLTPPGSHGNNNAKNSEGTMQPRSSTVVSCREPAASPNRGGIVPRASNTYRGTEAGSHVTTKSFEISAELRSRFEVACRIEGGGGIATSFSTAPGSRRPSGTSSFGSTEATRGSFELRTLTSRSGNYPNSGDSTAAIATSVVCKSRSEIRNRIETGPEAVSSSTVISSREFIQETRSTFASRASMYPNDTKKQPNKGKRSGDSLWNSPGRKISGKKGGKRTSLDLSYLPALFCSPELQAGEDDGLARPSREEQTQSFSSSLVEE